MAEPSRAERLVVGGLFGTVEYAVRANRTMEAKEWLESQTQQKQASFDVLFRRLVTQGRNTNAQQFRQLRLCFRLGKRWLLTHRIKKAGGRGKCPASEIQRADTIGHEHIAWEAARKGRSP